MTQKKKNILIINGHPDSESYNFALAQAYKTGAVSGGAVVEEIILRDLQFNPILNYGYRKRTTQEPDLEAAWKKIVWADHLVFVYPVWWGSTPALLKGFIDRVFLPGFAFRKKENSFIEIKRKETRYLSFLVQCFIISSDRNAWSNGITTSC